VSNNPSARMKHSTAAPKVVTAMRAVGTFGGVLTVRNLGLSSIVENSTDDRPPNQSAQTVSIGVATFGGGVGVPPGVREKRGAGAC
jgi:hypothetical protein